MAKKTKVKATKKTQTKQKQKQKQHQKQTVIVNVNTKKSTRSTSQSRTSKKEKAESQPLFTTLPIQYTPQTMYDLSNTRTRDADARYINQPEIPNAIPVMNIEIPNTTQLIAPPIAVATPIPLQKYSGTTAGKNTGDNYVETQDEEDERLFQLKLITAQNISYPTQQTTLRNIQRDFRHSQIPIPKRKEHSKRKINDDDESITNGAPPKQYHCQICGSNIKDSHESIRAHNRTLKHRNAEIRLLHKDNQPRQYKTPERKKPTKTAGSDSESSVNTIMSPAFIPPPPPSSPEGERFIGATVKIKRKKKKAVQNEL